MSLTATEYHARDYAENPDKYRARNKAYYEDHRLEILSKAAEKYASGCHTFRETLIANRAIVVIYDPIPVEDGGYTPGAMFPCEDLPYMLTMGSFTPGTIIERKGKRFTLSDKSEVRV